jgi:hypothetical protein
MSHKMQHKEVRPTQMGMRKEMIMCQMSIEQIAGNKVKVKQGSIT